MGQKIMEILERKEDLRQSWCARALFAALALACILGYMQGKEIAAYLSRASADIVEIAAASVATLIGMLVAAIIMGRLWHEDLDND